VYVAKPTSIAHDQRLVRSFELLCALQCGLVVLFFLAIWRSQLFFEQNVVIIDGEVVAICVLFTQFMGLRAVVSVPCLALIFGGMFTAAAVHDGMVMSDETRFATAALAVIAACATALGAVFEDVARGHFVTLIDVERERERLATHRAVVQTVLRVTVPPPLMARVCAATALEDALVTDAAAAAAVSFAGVCDFAHASTRMMPMDVVALLHRLFCAFDREAADRGAVKAMTYGDQYVACAGLMGAAGGSDAKSSAASAADGTYQVDNPAEAVVRLAAAQVAAARAVAADAGAAFRVGVGIATGQLSGGIAGQSSLRYLLAGDAFFRARELLVIGGAEGVLCDDGTAEAVKEVAGVTVEATTMRLTAISVVPPHFSDAGCVWRVACDDAPGMFEAAVHEGVVVVGRSDDDGDAEADAVFAGVHARLLYWPSCLHFVDDATNEAMRAFAVKDELVRGPYASLAFVGVAVGLLGLLFFDRVVVRPRGEVAMLDFAAVALLLGSLVITLTRFAAHRFRGWQWPAAVDLALIVVAIVDFFGAAACLDDTIISNDVTYLFFLLGSPLLVVSQRLPFRGTALIQFVAIFCPMAAVQWYKRRDSAFSLLTVAFLAVLYAALAYTTRRTLLRRFAVAELATAYKEVTEQRLAVQQRLLAALLPKHVVDEATALLAQGARMGLGAGAAPHAVERWTDLCVVQLRFGRCREACSDFRNLSEVTALIQRSVEAIGGDGLDLVQAVGDTYLIAGPLGSSDEADVREAAARTVRLVRRLPPLLGKDRPFVAALVCDSAFGALLGSQMMSFRLFGVAVQRSDALLAAAPILPRSVAVASDSFRRVYDGPRRVRVPSAADMGMSRAVRDMDDVASADVGHDALDNPLRGAAASGENVKCVFGDAMSWRVRGAGVAVVHALELDALDCC
jgi:class 3 adenylate cyclase